MKRFLPILFILLSASMAMAGEKIRVAIIDTGKNIDPKLRYCETGHKDFTGTGLTDNHGHGTNVAALINREAGNADFCIISLKYYNKTSTQTTQGAFLSAIRYATDLNVDVINISGGGPDYDREEAIAIQVALNKGIKIIAAAGNEETDFSQRCKYYPACLDDRVVSVGCMRHDYKPCPMSNFGGKIKMVQLGNLQEGMTGTSQATAIATGLFVKAVDTVRKKGK